MRPAADGALRTAPAAVSADATLASVLRKTGRAPADIRQHRTLGRRLSCGLAGPAAERRRHYKSSPGMSGLPAPDQEMAIGKSPGAPPADSGFGRVRVLQLLRLPFPRLRQMAALGAADGFPDGPRTHARQVWHIAQPILPGTGAPDRARVLGIAAGTAPRNMGRVGEARKAAARRRAEKPRKPSVREPYGTGARRAGCLGGRLQECRPCQQSNLPTPPGLRWTAHRARGFASPPARMCAAPLGRACPASHDAA